MSRLTEWFSGRSERERRCDAFVHEVNTQIKKKHRRLLIEAENQFKNDIVLRNARLQSIQSKPFPKQLKKGFTSSINRSADRSALLSKTMHMAVVDIWGFEKNLNQEVQKAAEEIVNLAGKYRTDDITRDDLIEDLPLSSHITVIFR